MKTVFLKELRENLKWAAVICGVIGIMVYWTIRRAIPILLQIQLPQPTTVLFGALAGLLMGFVQSLFETRPDNWAFVVHRPTSRPRIFIAKCAAGLLLLYVALGLPCALAGVWAARPGNLPTPFQSRMMLPVLADVLTAGCYYFVGIMLTLRKASWFGTRLLPLGLGLAATVATNFSQDFWMAALFILAVQTIGALGAWEAFRTGGAADGSGLPSFGLGAAIYCGAICVAILVVVAQGAFQDVVVWSQHRLDRQGNVLIITKTRSANEASTIITDAAGHILPEFEGVDPDDPANASRFLTGEKGLVDDRIIRWPFSLDLYGYRNPTASVIPLRSIAGPNVKVRWICLYNVERRLIELYDPTTTSLVGTVGPSGFASGQAQPGDLFPSIPFAQGRTRTLAFESAVYWVELDQRRVRRIFTPSADDPVVSANELLPATDPTVVIMTHRQIHVLNPSGEKLFSLPLDYDTGKYWFAVAMIPANQHFLLWAGTFVGETDPAFRQERSEYGLDGKLIRRDSIPAMPPVDTPLVRRRTAIFAAIHPLAGLPLFNGPMTAYVFDINADRHKRLFDGFLFASSALCAIITVLLSRLYLFSRRKTFSWTFANLLLGPAGVIVMIGLNERPAREACSVCGGNRLTGRRECPACGAGAAAPSFDGREIFEPVDAFSPAA